ncbi:MAG: PAS domain-containing protein [Xanthomonadaceae bacterium]|nr:PAS domain-containing protein [Xanthomonadaceae bacterium]
MIEIPDMDLACIAPNAKEITMKYYGGQERKVYVVDEEVPYPTGRLIVSRTNPEGVITQANKAFVDISGYERDELIGMPHCVLRHPDVPSAIFKDMWDHIKANKPWYGYVKNLCKDGRYYWVYASVNATYVDGELKAVTSVRRKPSREKVEETIELIKRLNAENA